MLLPRAVCKVRAAFTIVNKPFAPSLVSPPRDAHAQSRARSRRPPRCATRLRAARRRGCQPWCPVAAALRKLDRRRQRAEVHVLIFSSVCQCRPYTALHRLLRLMLIDPDCAGASEACIGRPSRQSCCTGYQTLEQPVWPRLGARAAGRHPRLRTHLLAPCRQAEAMHPGRSLAPAQRMPARVHLLC